MDNKFKNELIIGILIIFAIAMIFAGLNKTGSISAMISDINSASEFIKGFGSYSPLVLIIIQALQVVVAPVPGGLIGVAGGIVFGSVYGGILGTIGIILGSTVAFFIGRKLGRPAVEYFAGKKMAKFDNFFDKNGEVTLLFIYILPFFPDDLFCYIVGLSKMDFKKFLLVTVIGRGFNMFYLAFFGSEIETIAAHTLVISVIGLIALGFYLFREKLHKAIVRKSKP